MAGEILDFYDKKLDEPAVLRVFNAETADELFSTELGPNFFSKTPDGVNYVVNRDISVQYHYMGEKTIDVHAYIYLDKFAVTAFPETEVHHGVLLRFDMKKDTVIDSRSVKPTKHKKLPYRLKQRMLNAGMALVALALAGWTIWVTLELL